MLIKEPIIIPVVLLCAVCFIWFFLPNRRFSKIAILILDSAVIILSIGAILAGMWLRDRVLDESIKESTESLSNSDNDNYQGPDNRKENKPYSGDMATLKPQPESAPSSQPQPENIPTEQPRTEGMPTEQPEERPQPENTAAAQPESDEVLSQPLDAENTTAPEGESDNQPEARAEGVNEQQAEVPQAGTDAPEGGNVQGAEESQETGE